MGRTQLPSSISCGQLYGALFAPSAVALLGVLPCTFPVHVEDGRSADRVWGVGEGVEMGTFKLAKSHGPLSESLDQNE